MEKKLWLFDGIALSQDGDSNELYCCDPSVQTLSSVICTGSIPPPRSTASAAVIQDKVWLCGGKDDSLKFDLYELNMYSFSWTQLETGMPRPLIGDAPSGTLTRIQGNHLVLHGGVGLHENSTWIFDVESYTWKMHCEQDFRHYHSGINGLHDDVVIIGGFGSDKPFVNLRLSPKSLQQLAMRAVYGNRTGLPWKSLPPTLIHKMVHGQ